MAIAEQGRRRTGRWRSGGGGGEEGLELVHQSIVGEQHGDNWGGGMMASHFGLYVCV